VTESGIKLGPEADHVIVSVNPKAGKKLPRERVDRFESSLRKRGVTVEEMTDLAKVAARANELHEKGRLRALVGVGGDGTAAELTNRTNQGVPITLFPAGTANLIGKYFGLCSKRLGRGRRPEWLADVVMEGRLLQVDAGLASGRLFLVVMSCGLDAEVVRRVHEYRSTNPRGGHISYRTYLKPILSAIRSYDYPTCRISWYSGESPSPIDKERNGTSDARWGFIFNLPCYGWGLPLTPRAKGTDGLMDLCAFSGRSLFRGLKYVFLAHCGSIHPYSRECTMAVSPKYRVESDEPIPYQLDGDPGGVLPVEIETLPGRVTFVVPEKAWKKCSQ
jgi:diacylglycerol kinase (ATP)